MTGAGRVRGGQPVSTWSRLGFGGPPFWWLSRLATSNQREPLRHRPVSVPTQGLSLVARTSRWAHDGSGFCRSASVGLPMIVQSPRRGCISAVGCLRNPQSCLIIENGVSLTMHHSLAVLLSFDSRVGICIPGPPEFLSRFPVQPIDLLRRSLTSRVSGRRGCPVG